MKMLTKTEGQDRSRREGVAKTAFGLAAMAAAVTTFGFMPLGSTSPSLARTAATGETVAANRLVQPASSTDTMTVRVGSQVMYFGTVTRVDWKGIELSFAETGGGADMPPFRAEYGKKLMIGESAIATDSITAERGPTAGTASITIRQHVEL